MKNNSATTKSLLQQALRNLPDDFCFSETRFHLKEAINQIEKVEKRRNNNQKAQNLSENKGVAKVVPSPQTTSKTSSFTREAVYNPNKLLSVIDKMIAEEKAKLNKIGQNQEEDTPPDTVLG